MELKPAASVSKVRCWLEGKWFVVSGSWSVWRYPGYCNLQESFTYRLPGNAKHWELHLKINSCVCGSLSRFKKKKLFGCMPRTWGPPCLRQLKSQCTLRRVYINGMCSGPSCLLPSIDFPSSMCKSFVLWCQSVVSIISSYWVWYMWAALFVLPPVLD